MPRKSPIPWRSDALTCPRRSRRSLWLVWRSTRPTDHATRTRFSVHSTIPRYWWRRRRAGRWSARCGGRRCCRHRGRYPGGSQARAPCSEAPLSSRCGNSRRLSRSCPCSRSRCPTALPHAANTVHRSFCLPTARGSSISAHRCSRCSCVLSMIRRRDGSRERRGRTARQLRRMVSGSSSSPTTVSRRSLSLGGYR
jgi:hypothetical protein